MRLRTCRAPKKANIKFAGYRYDQDQAPKLGLDVLGRCLRPVFLKIVGYAFRFKPETRDWLEALNQAVMNQFTQGIADTKEQSALISDNSF